MLVLTLLCAHLSFFAVFIISKDLFLLLNHVSTLVLHVSISMQLQLTAEIRRQCPIHWSLGYLDFRVT